MARNKRSASPERAKKKRKVVLVKAQAAEQRGRTGAKATAKASNRPKPAPIPGGPAGRLLQFLGHERAEHPRSGSNTERAAEAQVEQEKPQPVAQKVQPVRTKHSSPNKTTKKGGKCAPESDSESSSDSRSSSPSPSPSPIMAPAVVPAKVPKRPKAASPKKEAVKVGKVKKRAAPPPALAPPAAKAKKINDGSSVATAPAKPKKTSEVPAPAQVKAKKTAPEKTQKPPKPSAPAAAPPTTQPELSELDQMGLQDAVLERLRTLCDKDVDPKVLAEYIVVLAQMNKGPDHLSGELEAFFSDKALLQSFVRWVEDSKWSFVPGGQPLKPLKSAQGGKGAQQIDLRGVAPDTNGTARLAKNVEAASAGPKTVRQGPHVAVTSRVVLQPNPNFDITPPVAKAPVSSPIKSPVSKVTAKAPTTRVMPYTLPPPHSAEAQQVQLLGEFTKTLQSILTKLQNPELDDSQREKYQAMADKIHSKIKTIKLAGSAPARRR